MNLKENQEFAQKIKKNGAMSAKMNQTSSKFRQFQQLALYSEPDQSSKNMIIRINGKDEQKWQSKQVERTDIEIVIGMKQPTGAKSIEKILLNLINMMPKPSSSFSVIYVNTLANGNAYGDFRKILQFLPAQYFIHLQKIYVLQGNFKNKASYWISFDYFTNYLKSKTTHFTTFIELADRTGLNKEKLLEILPAQIVKQLEKKEAAVKQILQIKKVKENIVFNTNVFNFQQQAYIQKKPKMIGNISKLSQSKQKSIQQYQVGQTGAPLIIQLLISFFNGKQELLNIEGLFRKSVSIDEETTLLKELSQQNYDYLQSIGDPHLIANGIKRFLSNLLEPIIPYQDYNDLMETDQANFNDKIIKIVTLLKNNRKMTLLLLVDFLKEKLLPRTQSNKMTQNNLSIVLGPCLMHSQVPSMKDLVYTKKSINAISAIFKDFDKIFGNAHQRTILIRKSVHIQERQTLKVRLEGSSYSLLGQDKQKSNEYIISHHLQKKDNDTESTNNILNGIFQMMKQEIIQSEQLQSQSNFQYDESFELTGQKQVKK